MKEQRDRDSENLLVGIRDSKRGMRDIPPHIPIFLLQIPIAIGSDGMLRKIVQ